LKILLKNKKYWTRHAQKYVYDVSNFFIVDFQLKSFFNDFAKSRNAQKALSIKGYLLASSIATATATVILSLWVVTCAYAK
jgi:hypothetical protein